MSPLTRQGLVLLAVALALGVVADVLVTLVPGRLDVVLGLGALVLAIVALAQTGDVTVPGSLAPLGAPLALLGERFATGALVAGWLVLAAPGHRPEPWPNRFR